jgi:argininosuccinate lyase
MARMLKAARQKLAQQDAWVKEKRAKIDSSLGRLDQDFNSLVKRAN